MLIEGVEWKEEVEGREEVRDAFISFIMVILYYICSVFAELGSSRR